MRARTPASSTEPANFAIAPMFYEGSWTAGWIFALDFATGGPFIPLMEASFEAYTYFETVQEEEPQRVCRYKVLITCLDDSTLEWYWTVEWDLDPYAYTYEEGAKAIINGVLVHGTGALQGFHGKSYVVARVLHEGTMIPELGGIQVGAVDPYDPELYQAWYHFDPFT